MLRRRYLFEILRLCNRLVLYKRLANCGSDAELTAMQEELIDRFGLPPEQTQALLACHRLRIAAKPLGVVKIDESDFVLADLPGLIEGAHEGVGLGAKRRHPVEQHADFHARASSQPRCRAAGTRA